MIEFFRSANTVYAVEAPQALSSEATERLTWLFGGARKVDADKVGGFFIGPRMEMISPWGTNAVEITRNMGIEGISRMEEFVETTGESANFDKLLEKKYQGLDQNIFKNNRKREPIVYIEDIVSYNEKEGLALSPDEIEYLQALSAKTGRKLTDSEVFGFSQVNSEHCRHKIFNGQFIVDGEAKDKTLFAMIKETTSKNRGRVVSAYTDNCALLQGPVAEQFAPATHESPDYFDVKEYESVITIKAETHNFPTTVEPFNGGATGAGGEIRDRIAGGKGMFPAAGAAVYMTSYPRLEEGRVWESHVSPRKWLYQTPIEILMKASNGASDFGNKFGQPLLCGSLHTFEHAENGKKFGFDKVIMQAGGIGYGRKKDSLKEKVEPGDKIVMLGGDNYRIGMGGGAGSSVATGEFADEIELNAIQRSNPEMQTRSYCAIRALIEEDINPIVSIHDHGAGGHLNCISELVEATGGRIDVDKLPVGDPTLSDKEIVGNESQERMGLILKDKDIAKFCRINERERSPFYVIGEATGDMQLTFVDNKTGEKPIDLNVKDLLGSTPRTIMDDKTINESYAEPQYEAADFEKYLENVLQLESIASKDWLTAKVDRSASGRVAVQQTTGRIQIPLNDYGVFALDYQGKGGIANALGHAPSAAMADEEKGSVLAITEALTNIVFAPITGGLGSVSLSANWMWPCKNPGEDARLYRAVEAASKYSQELGINIPTGKDSLSMTQKYPGSDPVYSPGTVIITSVAEVSDVKKCVTASLKLRPSQIVYVDMSRDGFRLGGSAFAQTLGRIGMDVPTVTSGKYFKEAFTAVQKLVAEGKALAGHDISGGGLITALLEMTFADNTTGIDVSTAALGETDLIKVLMSEKPALLLQVENGTDICEELKFAGVDAYIIGDVNFERRFTVTNAGTELQLDVDRLRDLWTRTSYLFDRLQSGEKKAMERFTNYKKQELAFKFPENFTGKLSQWGLETVRKSKSGIKAAVIREKGCMCEREMAWAMYLAGMDTKDVHMTDLIEGRETLEDVNMIVFVGGSSNSDVFGAAKGWAAAFLYNPKAKAALKDFYARKDTLSLGVGNGCQLMIELGLITPADDRKPKMERNESQKFESSFLAVDITGDSVMLGSLAGSRLGVWSANAQGKFSLPYQKEHYNIVMKYGYSQYPANPNGSDYDAAAIASADGRHLAMMPHPERTLKPWNWAYYPEDRMQDEVSPWIEAFVNARKWIEKANK